MGLRHTFFRGALWVGLLRGSTRGVSLVKIAVIARLLTPTQVGLYGLAFLVISFLEVFTETGVNVFLIQEKKRLEEYVSTAWIVSIIRGFFISGIIVLFSPYMANFLGSEEVYPLLLLVAAVPLLRGFINPSLVKFQKEMNFKSDFWFRFVIFFIDAVVGVVATMITKSPVGLIIGLIVGVMAEIVLSFVFIKPRPKFVFEFVKAMKIMSRGKWVTGTGIFQYLFREGDDLFVGKVLGSAPLGIYQYAYKIATLPISEVADVFGKVAFPLFVGITGDKRRLKHALYTSTMGVLALVIPFAVILFMFSETIVYLLLGNQWLAAAPVLKTLVIYSVIRAGIEPAMRVFLAVKKQEYTAVVTAVSLVVLGVGIFPLAANYGLVGVGMATIIASAASIPPVIYLTGKALR